MERLKSDGANLLKLERSVQIRSKPFAAEISFLSIPTKKPPGQMTGGLKEKFSLN